MCRNNLIKTNINHVTCTCLHRHFDTTGIEKTPAIAAQLFSVPDFVGDACKAIASRVRGAVASVQFDDFHKVRFVSQIIEMLYLC